MLNKLLKMKVIIIFYVINKELLSSSSIMITRKILWLLWLCHETNITTLLLNVFLIKATKIIYGDNIILY